MLIPEGSTDESLRILKGMFSPWDRYLQNPSKQVEVSPIACFYLDQRIFLFEWHASEVADSSGRTIRSLRGIYVPEHFFFFFWALMPQFLRRRESLFAWSESLIESGDQLFMEPDPVTERDFGECSQPTLGESMSKAHPLSISSQRRVHGKQRVVTLSFDRDGFENLIYLATSRQYGGQSFCFGLLPEHLHVLDEQFDILAPIYKFESILHQRKAEEFADRPRSEDHLSSSVKEPLFRRLIGYFRPSFPTRGH